MSNLTLFILLTSATWRVTSLLHSEAGPWHTFTHIRTLIGIEHDGDDPIGYPNTFWGGLFKCYRCLSVWVSGGLVIITALSYGLTWWTAILLWLAASGGAIVIEEYAPTTEE